MARYQRVETQEPGAPPMPLNNRRELTTSDPLISAFGGSDSDGDSDWEDDRRSDNTHSSPSETLSIESSNTPSSYSSGETANTSDSHPRSLWSSLYSAVTRRPRHNTSDFSDGVFGNLVAKEETEDAEPNADIDLETGLMPGDDDDDSPRDQPPTYDEASADATPSYWETTIMASSYGDEIIVGNMPVGSPIVFAWNMLLSTAFSYLGFLLTFLFHTTHAALGGSMSGLGITLIQSSYSIVPEYVTPIGAPPDEMTPVDPNGFQDGPPIGYVLHPTGQSATNIPANGPRDYSLLSSAVFMFGVILLFAGVFHYAFSLRAHIAIKAHRERQEQAAATAQETGRQQFENNSPQSTNTAQPQTVVEVITEST